MIIQFCKVCCWMGIAFTSAVIGITLCVLGVLGMFYAFNRAINV